MNLKNILNILREDFPPYNFNAYGINDIYKITDIYLNKYKNLVCNLFEEDLLELGTNKSHLIQHLELSQQIILEAIRLYMDNEIIKSHDLIYNYFLNPETGNKNIFIKPVNNFNKIYRMRESLQANQNIPYLEMFHIPFEKIALTKSQRFSIQGFPFLYAGNSIKVCWEEIGKPNLTKINVSALRIERPIFLFDLLFPSEIKRKEDLLRIPLIISCSIKRFTNNQEKTEYIIPQALLHGIIQFNTNINQFYISNPCDFDVIPLIDGIMYLSTKIEGINRIQEVENTYCNYVFPIKEQKNKGHCNHLCDLFTITDSVNLKKLIDLIKIKDRHLNFSYNQITNSQVDYIFELFDKYISSHYCAKYSLKNNP